MIDPNSSIASAREVRVTMRGVRLTDGGEPVQVSTRSDFIAPDLSPVRTVDIECEKGERGWTGQDVKLVDARPLHIQRADRARKAQALADLNDLVLGTPIVFAKAPTADKRRVVNNVGPSAKRRAARSR